MDLVLLLSIIWILQVDRATHAQLFWSPDQVEFTQDNPCQNGGVCLNLRRPHVGREPVTCSATSCVKVFREEASDWTRAMATCRQNGGHLVSFENAAEKEHITAYISEQVTYKNNGDTHAEIGFWTSGKYYEQDKVWFWHDRSSPVSRSLFQDTPTSAVVEQCLTLNFTSDDEFRLESESCALEKYFICELSKEVLVRDWTYACHCRDHYYGYNCEHHSGLIETSACEGSTFDISCPEGLLIQINEAEFVPAGGRCGLDDSAGTPTVSPCRNADISSWMRQQCDGREFCRFEVTSNLPRYQPCPERRKVLNVIHQCFDKPAYTKFPCERTNVSLSCKHDEKILVEYANYGRLNRTICIVDKEEDMDRCRAIDSLNIVAGKCNGESVCTIGTENSVFGDPCNGFFKYLETRYRCVKGDITFKYPPIPGWVPPTTPPPKTHCDPLPRLGFHWPETTFGDVAYASCIVDDRYSAFWACSAEYEEWDPIGPNITHCPSQWIYDIESKLQNMSISTASIAQSVFDQVSSGEGVTSDVIRQSVVIMDALLDRQRLQLLNNTDGRGVQETLVDFNRVMLQLGGKLIEGVGSDSWPEDLEPDEAITVFNITDLLESCSLFLAENLDDNHTSEEIETDEIKLEVTKIRPINNHIPTSVRFPLTRRVVKGRVQNYEVHVPTLLGDDADRLRNEEVTMSILVYNSLDRLLEATLEESNPGNDSSVAPATSESSTMGYNATSIIASVVIGVTMRIGEDIISDLGGQQINFTLKHKNMSLEGETSCVFWDHSVKIVRHAVGYSCAVIPSWFSLVTVSEP